MRYKHGQVFKLLVLYVYIYIYIVRICLYLIANTPIKIHLVYRYWAITDPMTYPAKMSDRKAGILILIVWVCSSAISFPAIAWWRAAAPVEDQAVHNTSMSMK